MFIVNVHIKLPSTRKYWSSSLAVPQVANLMPVSQSEELRKYLHFSDNTNASTSDKINKIRPLVDKLNKRIQLVPIEENLVVDKQIVPFKGRHSIKQYNPKKAHKWVFKVFVLKVFLDLVTNLKFLLVHQIMYVPQILTWGQVAM